MRPAQPIVQRKPPPAKLAPLLVVLATQLVL